MSDAATEVQRLTRENEGLRAELSKVRGSEQRARAGKKQILKIGWSIFFPLFDRRKVVRHGMQLFGTLSGLTGPREGWPSTDSMLADAKEFAQSLLRFHVRRQTIVLILGLTAFVIPGVQIWLVYRQNEIIENQNKFFEIEVFDTTARGLTTGTVNSRQMTSALLDKVDLDLLAGMVEGVFESDVGGTFSLADGTGQARRLEAAAFRGYMISAVSRQLQSRGKTEDLQELQDKTQRMFELIVEDAAFRVQDIMRVSRNSASSNLALGEEVAHYLSKLFVLMGVEYRLARTLDDEARYFKTIAPFVELTSRRMSSFGDEGPFQESLQVGVEEWLLDLGQQLPFGEPPPKIREEGVVDRLKKRGFDELQSGIGKQARVKWSNLKKVAGVP